MFVIPGYIRYTPEQLKARTDIFGLIFGTNEQGPEVTSIFSFFGYKILAICRTWATGHSEDVVDVVFKPFGIWFNFSHPVEKNPRQLQLTCLLTTKKQRYE